MFTQDLIFVNKEFKTRDNFFDFLFDTLDERNLVYPEYKNKIKEREDNYPTGIKLESIGIAIPHAEAEYAKGNTFVLITNKGGIPFRNMEDGSPMLAYIVIALVFNNKDKHIEHLQYLADLLQSEPKLREILEAETSQDVLALLD